MSDTESSSMEVLEFDVEGRFSGRIVMGEPLLMTFQEDSEV